MRQQTPQTVQQPTVRPQWPTVRLRIITNVPIQQNISDDFSEKSLTIQPTKATAKSSTERRSNPALSLKPRTSLRILPTIIPKRTPKTSVRRIPRRRRTLRLKRPSVRTPPNLTATEKTSAAIRPLLPIRVLTTQAMATTRKYLYPDLKKRRTNRDF